MPPILFLGPQRFEPTLAGAVESLGLEPPFAVITAGWQEREREVDELAEHLGSELLQLRLYSRTERIFRADPELFDALRRRQDRLRRLQTLYRIRLGHALEAVRALLAREGDPELLDPEREAAFEAVRVLDRHHLARLREVHELFVERWRPAERPAVRRHRREVASLVRRSSGVLVAGGHVLILLNRMGLLGVGEPIRQRPVIAWSAGAMALSERVVLFHDSPPQGAGNAEIIEAGLGLVPGVVALPHAHSRLRLDDPVRVALLARRFAPAAAVALDRGTRLAWDGGRLLASPGTDRLGSAGGLETMESVA